MSAIWYLVAIVAALGVFGVGVLARAMFSLDYDSTYDDEEITKRTHIEPSGSFSSPEGKSGSDNLTSSL